MGNKLSGWRGIIGGTALAASGLLYRHAFTAHPYRHPTIGSMVDLEAASVEDVRELALPILRHRLITNFTAQSEGVSVDEVIRRLLQDIPKN